MKVEIIRHFVILSQSLLMDLTLRITTLLHFPVLGKRDTHTHTHTHTHREKGKRERDQTEV